MKPFRKRVKRSKARNPKESQIRGEGIVGNKEWPEREEYDMRLSPINTKRKRCVKKEETSAVLRGYLK